MIFFGSFSKSYQPLGITWYWLVEITRCQLIVMKFQMKFKFLCKVLPWKRKMITHKKQRHSFGIIKLNYTWLSFFGNVIMVIEISLILTGVCCQSCCQNLVNITFPERKVQRFTNITRSCNNNAIIIIQTDLNRVSAFDSSCSLSLVTIPHADMEIVAFSKLLDLTMIVSSVLFILV